MLAMTPAGLSAQALARCLYGPGAKAVTVRAEIARVRRVAGELIGAQPYRLAADVRADFLDVERLLSRRRVAAAVTRYAGPLLPALACSGDRGAPRRAERALRDAVVTRATSRCAGGGNASGDGLQPLATRRESAAVATQTLKS